MTSQNHYKMLWPKTKLWLMSTLHDENQQNITWAAASLKPTQPQQPAKIVHSDNSNPRIPCSWSWTPVSGYNLCCPSTAQCSPGVLYQFPCHSRGLVLTTSTGDTKQRSKRSLYICNYGMKAITLFQALILKCNLVLLTFN